MPDIAFICPSCSRSLTIDATGAGMDVDCPNCNATVKVPPPDLTLPKCPACSAEFPDAARICSRCGYDRLTGENAFEIYSAEQTKGGSDPEESSKFLGTEALGVIIGVGSVFLIICWIAWMGGGFEGPPAGENPPSQMQQASPNPQPASTQSRSTAYDRGERQGRAYGKMDRDLNSYDHFNPDFAGQVRIAFGIQPGTSEYGDFWAGYKEGYLKTR